MHPRNGLRGDQSASSIQQQRTSSKKTSRESAFHGPAWERTVAGVSQVARECGSLRGTASSARAKDYGVAWQTTRYPNSVIPQPLASCVGVTWHQGQKNRSYEFLLGASWM